MRIIEEKVTPMVHISPFIEHLLKDKSSEIRHVSGLHVLPRKRYFSVIKIHSLNSQNEVLLCLRVNKNVISIRQKAGGVPSSLAPSMHSCSHYLRVSGIISP